MHLKIFIHLFYCVEFIKTIIILVFNYIKNILIINEATM